MIRKFFVIVFLLTSALWAQGINFNGYVRTYLGTLVQQNYEYAIVQNTFNLNLEHSGDIMVLKASPFIYQYSDNRIDFILREIYMDIYFESIDIRIGKQQIVWGKADGVFITDIVSPKDLREFLLPDFDEIRIGVTSVKLDYYIGDNTLEVVWIPVFTPTRMPSPESIWFPRLDLPMEPEWDFSKQEVKGSLENSEVFGKFSALTSFIDFELMAGYAWDDDPTMHLTKNIENGQLVGLTITPIHHRLTLGGGSFSTTLGGFVVRGEAAYYTGKYFVTADPMAANGVVEKDYLHYLLGLDYTLWDIRLSGQFIQQAILDYESPIQQDEMENTATFLARRDFLRETLTVELFSYIGINNNDALIRPRVYYDIADGFEILIGANIFTGDTGRFGQYNGNNMIYTKLKYSF
ncbi:MAG TPA: hypothetical protein ENK44_10280 [Caldithrix abyssi]|uniref:Uncharacterized protein n=1 Tax=Caldithrix abyssi TaxID=187145 RepID=A0A7V4U142_CALAY|nr:hypothetical protein [Caldithrix abyssi]